MQWANVIKKGKEKHHQTIEGYFLNSNGTLNYQSMVEWVESEIAQGTLNPFDILKDGNRHARRTERRALLALQKETGKNNKIELVSHPDHKMLKSLKEQMNKPIED